MSQDALNDAVDAILASDARIGATISRAEIVARLEDLVTALSSEAMARSTNAKRCTA